MAVDVVVATRLKCFHQSFLAAVAHRDDRQICVLYVCPHDFRQFECAHFAHVTRANDRRGRVVLQRRKSEGRLRCGDNLETFALQSVAQSLGKEHIAVDQQNLGGLAGEYHASTSAIDVSALGFAVITISGVNAWRFRTSITSPLWESQAAT